MTKAWNWAKQNNRFRVHEVHGEEEIYITTSESFEIKNTDVEEMTKKGQIEVQEL